jgi:pimeloyl-ACP methyl ester carboxylesterase
MPAMRILLGKYATLPLCRMLQVAIRSVASRTLHARLGAIASVDVAAELARVTVPLMYLQARNDMLVPPSAAETIQRIQPTSKIVQVDGPHFLLQVNPRQASESIRQFIAGLQPTG